MEKAKRVDPSVPSTSPQFRYRPSFDTDIRRTFRRIQREAQQQQRKEQTA